jgi:hypothetical protein
VAYVPIKDISNPSGAEIWLLIKRKRDSISRYRSLEGTGAYVSSLIELLESEIKMLEEILVKSEWPSLLDGDIVRKLQRKEITREEYARLANKQALALYNMVASNGEDQ